VFPYFLFTGVLVKRIYSETDAVAANHPEIQFIKASYLSDHPLVIDTFQDRVQEIVDGQALMNCQMCKYREQVLGFEAEVGLPQESHHHHVEGIGGGLENCPCKGDCDASCRDEDFCKLHGLPWTPVHSHASPAPLTPVHDHSHDHAHPHQHDHDHPHDHAHGHSHDHGHDPRTPWPRPRPCARSSSPPLSACRPSAWAALDGKEEELNLDRASAHS
jgi:sirohydrochlorin cobaltochelatase